MKMNDPRRFVPLVAVVLTTACAGAPVLETSASAIPPGLARGIAVADSSITAALGMIVPGAVFVVSKNGHLVHERAFGYARTGTGTVTSSMHASTIFDLASVTKVMATTFAMMMLVDQGKVDLGAPVYTYLPDFRGAHLDSITVRNLLQHSAGLVQWQPPPPCGHFGLFLVRTVWREFG